METIGDNAFESCGSLKCIYFCGQTSPTVSSSAFSGVPTSHVVTLEKYQSETFGNLSVSKGTTIEGCLPMPTLTFTVSSIFTQSNAFTASLPSGAIFTNTFILTYSLSLTQTMSIYNSALSLSFTISENTYIITKVIYYAYTAVAYSFYHSYYINVFTIFYPSGAPTVGSKVAIIAGCTASAAIVVVVVLVVVLIKIRSRKQTSGDQESDELEQNDFEATNAFSAGLSVSHIEEDPFANDFIEDKFIDKI